MSEQRQPEEAAGIGMRLLEGALVVVLAVMAAMVFGNVVLRYGFASGITVSEELSRLLFVWLTFVGAIPVMRYGGHLAVNLFLPWLPAGMQRLCRILSNLLMLACCAVFGWGAWEQTQLNWHNYAPVSGLPTALAYAAAVISAIGLGLLIAGDLVRSFRDPDSSRPGGAAAPPA
jgi:TRAP-type C4-dicarboxylate transport system permease small subunit